MEAGEREKYMKDRHKKIIAAEAKLIQKQQNEMNALKKKLEGNLNERLKLRETEHNKLLQRYQNVKKEIVNRQTQEMNKFVKDNQRWAPKADNSRPGTATQRSMMGSRMQGSRMMAQKSAAKA
jgi:predicted nuclease with TOPRIM domain|tara:strand:- start:31 stop:399 length:369 start_codon:yes stop_codon:yes gene_type:complete